MLWIYGSNWEQLALWQYWTFISIDMDYLSIYLVLWFCSSETYSCLHIDLIIIVWGLYQVFNISGQIYHWATWEVYISLVKYLFRIFFKLKYIFHTMENPDLTSLFSEFGQCVHLWNKHQYLRGARLKCHHFSRKIFHTST